MNICLKETINNYSAELQLCFNDDVDQIESSLRGIEGKINNHECEINFVIDDFVEYEGSSFDELIKAVISEKEFWGVEDAKVNIYISVNKKTDNPIVDEKTFIDGMLSLDFINQIKNIDEHFIKPLIINSELSEFLLKKADFLSNISNDKTRISITPIHLNIIIDSNFKKYPELCKYFASIRTILSLAMITERIEIEDNNLFAFVSNDLYFDFNDVKYYSEDKENIIYDIFLWCFEDESYKIKSSVFNTVISLQPEVSNSIDSKFLPILKTNLNILLKDNFKDYLEARNSVLNFVFELSNKLKEELVEYKSSFNNTLMVIISFLFTSIVFTVIDKGKFIDFFTFHINIMITLMLIGAFVYINMKQLTMEKVLEFHIAQRDEFKDKNRNIFSDEEIDNFLEPKSLKNLIKQLKSRTTLYVYQSLLLFVCLVIWSLYIFK